MKNFLIICSIFILAFLVRFYHFEDRIIFWTEQARSLITSLEYLEKPSLLGQEYFRQDSNSHIIFSGALFNWALLPIILFSNYDIARITAFFVFLNIFTGLTIFLVSRRFFGLKTAIYSTILFLFSYLMIYHSLFIWNYNFLPLVGLLVFHLTLQNFKVFKLNNFFWLGLICGIGISFQIWFAVFTVLALIVNLFKSKQKVYSLILFLLGVVLGNLPMVIFDLRHDFYLTKTIWQYFIDTISGVSDANFAYYYLLPIVPVLTIFLGRILSKLNIFVSISIIIIYLFFNLKSLVIVPDLTVSQIEYVSREIANDAKGDFNVASVIDFDKRAYALRYLLKYKYEKKVMGIGEYQNLNLLYVIAPNEYNFKSSDTWEIKAGGNYKVSELQSINSKFKLFKLTK